MKDFQSFIIKYNNVPNVDINRLLQTLNIKEEEPPKRTPLKKEYRIGNLLGKNKALVAENKILKSDYEAIAKKAKRLEFRNSLLLKKNKRVELRLKELDPTFYSNYNKKQQ